MQYFSRVSSKKKYMLRYSYSGLQFYRYHRKDLHAKIVSLFVQRLADQCGHIHSLCWETSASKR